MILFLFVLFGAVRGQYNCDDPCNDMCCTIPSDQLYYLTDFCDETTACGVGCSALTYFSADSQRFGCGVILTICVEGSSSCINVRTIDAGPNIAVEQEAGRPIIDASVAVCSGLFGQSSCGWSDRLGITAYQSGTAATKYGLGPFNATIDEMQLFRKEHFILHHLKKK